MAERRAVAVLLLSLTACQGIGPTAPTAVSTVSRPQWVLKGDSPGEAALVEATWQAIASCVNLAPTLYPAKVAVTLVPGAFECGVTGPAGAAGCFAPPNRVTVARPWLADALAHEFIHLALYSAGRPWGHEAPEFSRCF